MMVTVEFSRIFLLDKLKSNRNTLHVEATADERLALAKRFSLVSINMLKAEYHVTKKEHDNNYDVEGVLHADVVQSCVTTLADVPQKLTVPVRITLIEGEEDEDLDEIDWLQEEADREYYQSNEIDFGEITSQYLSLALPPYPKAPGVKDDSESENVIPLNNPFSALQRLKK